jgi:hypothetical protein
MKANRLQGAVYGLLEAYKYVIRKNASGALVPYGVLDSLLSHQTIPDTCVPRVCFGPLVSAAVTAALIVDKDRRMLAYTRASAHMQVDTQLDTQLDALELITAFGEACHMVVAMPPENIDPEVFLTRYFYTKLGPDNQRVAWGVRTWMTYPPEGGPWPQESEHALYRYLATSLLVLARFAGQPHLTLLQLHLKASRPHDPDLITHLHAAALTTTLGVVCGARLGADKLGDAFLRALHAARRELFPKLDLPRDGFFLLHKFLL